jgi:hypothetical protein
MITNVKTREMTIGDLLTPSAFGFTGFDMTKWLDMPISSLKGYAPPMGYNERGDVITETTDGAPLNQMWDEFQRTLRIWNAQRDSLTNLLSHDINSPIESVRYPIDEDFEEASEFGEPKGIRLGPSFRMGYSFKWWDLAIRYTWMFLAEADADQLRNLNNMALEADNRLMFTRIMKQVFNSTTVVATINGDPINVYPFYNGDSMVPPKWKNTTFTAPHTHYLTSGAATIDSGDLDQMQDHLTHHGYTAISGYRMVLLVNPAQGATIRGFKVATGSKYDFIPSANVGGGIIFPANGGIIGAPQLVNLPGLISIGTYGQFTIVEEDYIPVGYVFAFVTGGERSINNPVGIRQHENGSLRGVRLVKGRDNDYPLIDSFYVHGLGTGIRQRGAGVVMQITVSGTYTVPTEYQ